MMRDRSHMKLGRKAIKTDSRTLQMARYMTAALPPAPLAVDWTKGITNWGMMLNDSLGDCLVGDTLTVSPRFSKAYRALYDGPVINIVTRTGKRLTTTRNHPVLTSNGFLAAHLIKPRDRVLSSNFPQAVAARIGNDLQDAPSSIEDVFKAHERVALSRSVERKVNRSVDFHGDAEFFKSKVHIVDTDPLLWNSDVSPFGQPKRQLGLASSGELALPFNGFGSTFTENHPILFAPSRSLRSGSVLTALFRSHLGLAKKARFASRPYHASTMKKGINSSPTDCELPSKLLRDFSGQILLDDVVSVSDSHFKGHVYDASTDEKWYIANGILTHNCTIAAVAHAVQVWSANVGSEVTVPDSTVLQYYEQWDGYVNGDPSTDNGGVELSVLSDWQKNGFAGHQLLAFADTESRILAHVRQAINLFGGVYIGLALPLSARSQSVWENVPDDGTGNTVPGSWGGHAVFVCKYDQASFTCISWGELITMTNGFWKKYVDEVHCLLSPDFIASNGLDPQGFNLQQLQADLAKIR